MNEDSKKDFEASPDSVIERHEIDDKKLTGPSSEPKKPTLHPLKDTKPVDAEVLAKVSEELARARLPTAEGPIVSSKNKKEPDRDRSKDIQEVPSAKDEPVVISPAPYSPQFRPIIEELNEIRQSKEEVPLRDRIDLARKALEVLKKSPPKQKYWGVMTGLLRDISDGKHPSEDSPEVRQLWEDYWQHNREINRKGITNKIRNFFDPSGLARDDWAIEIERVNRYGDPQERRHVLFVQEAERQEFRLKEQAHIDRYGYRRGETNPGVFIRGDLNRARQPYQQMIEGRETYNETVSGANTLVAETRAGNFDRIKEILAQEEEGVPLRMQELEKEIEALDQQLKGTDLEAEDGGKRLVEFYEGTPDQRALLKLWSNRASAQSMYKSLERRSDTLEFLLHPDD
jgi:hypothetical protein